MGRKHRSDFEYAFHHVFNRASARRMIFRKEEHCHTFLNILEHVIKTDSIEVHAYCLMGNHYHLLLRTPRANLSEAMHRLGSMFTRRYNRKEKIDGPLFRGRYKSKVVGNDDYLRQLCRYIHRNPVAAGIVRRPEDYHWSSYKAYALELSLPFWLIRHELPNYFTGSNPLISMREFVEKSTKTKFDGISLEKFLKASYDEPLIASSRCITRPQEGLQKLRLEPAVIEEIIETVSRYYNVSERTLFTCTPGIKNHPRDIAIYLFREEALIKMSNIAKKFSIGRAAASSVVSRIKMRIQSERCLEAEIRILRNAIQMTKTR
jgi:REP-associated tyrosine transposase